LFLFLFSLSLSFFFVTTVFPGVQGSLVKNKTVSYAPGNTVTISIEVNYTLEANSRCAIKEIPFLIWNLKFHYWVHTSLLFLAVT
jgi:hypothetical protein